MSGDGAAIRRRRVCGSCKRRFTTYERIEETPPMVVKKDNRREPYDRAKIIAGLTKACEKRPVSMETIAAIGDRIEAAPLSVRR
jgi:transcriptional repressor NrdR